MIIKSNLEAITAMNSLKKTESARDKALGKLSSGYKINCAADNSASLSISEGMRAQIRGLNQASNNIQDGISMISTADGVMGEMQSMLHRIRELAVQAANDTNTDDDRKMINLEVEELKSQINSVFKKTEFNTIKIFDQEIRYTKTPISGQLPGDTKINYGLTITAGYNDTLTFRASDIPASITLSPGSYTTDALVDHINQKLAAAGTDVTVSFPAGSESLVFDSPSGVLDSFGGTMMRIDAPNPFTSILYDNIKSGSKYLASYTGAKDISSGITFDSTNNNLRFNVNSAGVAKTASITFEERPYPADEIIAAINDYLQANNMDATASLTNTNTLKISQNISGSNYTITGLTGIAVNDLFTNITTSYTNPSTTSASNGSGAVQATLTGGKSYSGSIEVKDKENVLRFSLGGIAQAITIEAKTYHTPKDLLDELNGKLSALGVTVSLSNDTTGQFKFTVDAPSTASINNFYGILANNLLASTTSGSASSGTTQWYEGGMPPAALTASYYRGGAGLPNGTQIIAGINDTLTYQVNGVTQTTVLTEGWYNRTQLLTELNNKMSGVTVSYDSSSRLVFTNNQSGYGNPIEGSAQQYSSIYSVNNFGGNAFDTLIRNSMPTGTVYSSGGNAATNLIRRAYAFEGATIDSTNNQLIINVNNNGTQKSYTLTLSDGTYSTYTAMAAEIKKQIDAEPTGVLKTLVEVTSNNTLTLNSLIPGTDNRLISLGGTAYDTVYRARTVSTTAAYRAPSGSETYADGRLDLSNGPIVIEPGKNDTLTFDLNHDGNTSRVSIVLEKGQYDADTLVQQINKQLAAANIPVEASYNFIATPTNSLDALRLTYVTGQDGIYTIDGIGGSAAYSVFYPGPYTEEYSGSDKLILQVGANSGNEFRTDIPILLNCNMIGIEKANVLTRASAGSTISRVDRAIQLLSYHRSIAGAHTNSLEHIWNNVNNASENLQASESKIRDADMACEMMTYARLNVLSQSTQAMLVNANANKQHILELLK